MVAGVDTLAAVLSSACVCTSLGATWRQLMLCLAFIVGFGMA